jgi:hypothetical protein
LTRFAYSLTSQWPTLNITEASLNEALANLTMNVMFSIQQWNKVVSVEIQETSNVYSFAAPKNLIIPYFLSLGVVLLFLVLGGISTYRNGVSAINRGFIQIRMTTTGSKALEQAAVAGYLGGYESISKDLPDLQIHFGELVDHGCEAGGLEELVLEPKMRLFHSIGELHMGLEAERNNMARRKLL